MPVYFKSGEQIFHLSELHAGGGGMRCEKSGCKRTGNSGVLLSADEVAELLSDFKDDPEVVFRRGLGGDKVSLAILGCGPRRKSYGRVFCPEHLAELGLEPCDPHWKKPDSSK